MPTDGLKPGLRPMLLMVCADCAIGNYGDGEYADGCAVCWAQAEVMGATELLAEPRSARTREEMVEDIIVARYGYSRPWPGRRKSIAADLIAAGVIQSEEERR
jgi:hypothetical protein